MSVTYRSRSRAPLPADLAEPLPPLAVMQLRVANVGGDHEWLNLSHRTNSGSPVYFVIPWPTLTS